MRNMNIYDSLLGAVHSEYDVLMLIKKGERGEVSLARHRDSGTVIFSGIFMETVKFIRNC